MTTERLMYVLVCVVFFHFGCDHRKPTNRSVYSQKTMSKSKSKNSLTPVTTCDDAGTPLTAATSKPPSDPFEDFERASRRTVPEMNVVELSSNDSDGMYDDHYHTSSAAVPVKPKRRRQSHTPSDTDADGTTSDSDGSSSSDLYDGTLPDQQRLEEVRQAREKKSQRKAMKKRRRLTEKLLRQSVLPAAARHGSQDGDGNDHEHRGVRWHQEVDTNGAAEQVSSSVASSVVRKKSSRRLQDWEKADMRLLDQLRKQVTVKLQVMDDVLTSLNEAELRLAALLAPALPAAPPQEALALTAATPTIGTRSSVAAHNKQALQPAGGSQLAPTVPAAGPASQSSSSNSSGASTSAAHAEAITAAQKDVKELNVSLESATSELLNARKRLRDASDCCQVPVARQSSHASADERARFSDMSALIQSVNTKSQTQAKLRKFPEVAKFRQTLAGKPLSRDDYLFDPTRYFDHLVQTLEEDAFEPEPNISRFIVQQITGVSNRQWAFDLFLSTKASHVAHRRQLMKAMHVTTALQFVRTSFIERFQVADAGFGYVNALTRYKWAPRDSVETNMDNLAEAALVSRRDVDDELVMNRLMAQVPTDYKRKLLEYVTKHKHKRLAFGRARQIMTVEEQVLDQLQQEAHRPPSSDDEPPSKRLKRGRVSTPKSTDKSNAAGNNPIPPELWSTRPMFTSLVNPEGHAKGMCFGCGSADHRHFDESCGQFKRTKQRLSLYETKVKEWQVKVQAVGCEIPYYMRKKAGRDEAKADAGKVAQPPVKKPFNKSTRTRRVTVDDPEHDSSSYDSSDDDYAEGSTAVDVDGSQEFAESRNCSRVTPDLFIDSLSQADSANFIPVLLKDEHGTKWLKVMAFNDSGCEATIIDYEMANQWGLKLFPPKTPTQLLLANKSSKIVVTDQAKVWMRANGKKVLVTANITHCQDGILLGHKERQAWNIHWVNVPFKHDDSTDEHEGSAPDVPTEPTLDEQELARERTTADLADVDTPLPLDQQRVILAAVQADLDINEAIPIGSFCNHPAATVHLNTGDNQPVARHQYPMSDAARFLVTEWLEDMLAAGIVELGNPATPWLNPLHLAANKKAASAVYGPRAASASDVTTISESATDSAPSV